MDKHVSKSGIIVGVTDILSKLNERLAYEGEGIEEKTTSKGNVAVTRKYTLVNKKGDKTTLTINDSAMIESIDKINLAQRAQNVTGYVICRELAKIAESPVMKQLGFKNIAEFGRCVFGFATSTSNHYAKIGKYFITDDYKVVDGLPDLSISHFIELNAKVGEDGNIQPIIDLFLEGTLTDGMSTKALRTALLKSNKVIETTATDVTDETTETTATTETTSTTETTATTATESKGGKGAFDAQVEIQKALDSIAKFMDAYSVLIENGFSELPNWHDFVKSIVEDLSAKLATIDE